VTPIEGTCCSENGMGGPDTDGDNLCDRSPFTWSTDTWSALAFNAAGEHYGRGCGTAYGPDTCDANQHAYVYAFESAGVGGDATMTASATTHVDCDACQAATVSVTATLDPDATWLTTGDVTTCATGCMLMAPEHLAITVATSCEGGVVSGHIALTETQQAGFLPPEGTHSLHPWWDELNTWTDAMVAGAVAAYQASDPTACSFPAAQGVTPIEQTCCSAGGLGGPDTDDDDLCDLSPDTWSTNTWSALGFVPDAPHGFVYETETSGEGLDAVFSVSAYADLDCDGFQSTFRRTVTVADAALGWDTGTPDPANLQEGTCTPLGGDAAWAYPTRAIYFADKHSE